MPNEGLFWKYIIKKSDGSPIDPKADYFILRLDTDPIARIAATEYAIHTDDERLGKELQRRVSEHLVKSFESVDSDHVARRKDSWPLAALRQDEIVFGHLSELIEIGNKRIAELEADNQKWREYNLQLYKANRKLLAALKKLGQAKRERGKALVEERAVRIAYENDMQLCECKEYAKCQARKELRQEGRL